MIEPVKRQYSSAVRSARARETRARIVAAAHGLYIQQGYGITTVDQVAAEAGLSRKTVFATVGGKLELLKAAMDTATVGDSEPVPLLARPEVRVMLDQLDLTALLTSWANLTATVSARLALLSVVLHEAAGTDPSARSLVADLQQQRLSGALAFVSFAAERHGLRPGVSLGYAADVAWLHSDPLVYRRLVVERGWKHEQFEQWLARTMIRELAP